MRVFFSALLCFLFLGSYNSYAQINFDKEQSAADPVKKADTFSAEKKIAIHQAYLAKAVETNNLQQKFYGHLYLWADHLGKNDYKQATLELFTADSIAQRSGNLSWQAAVHSKRGILDFELNDAGSALKNFRLTLEECSKTKDSACIAFNLKELGLVYHRLKKYDSAKKYFQLAGPLIRKYTDSNKLYAYYSNYSNLFIEMGDYNAGKIYLDSAMFIAMSGNDILKQSFSKNNLAALYRRMGENDKALKILEECVVINKEHGWYEQLSFNYANLSDIFSKKGDYHAAFTYLQDYLSINDSLKGAELQVKMVNLNADFETQKKELVLKQNQLELEITKQKVKIRTGLIILLFIGMGIKLWLFVAYRKRVKKRRLQSQQDLAEVTRILLDKNTALSELEEKLSKRQGTTVGIEPLTVTGIEPFKQEENNFTADKDDFEKQLYNQRILTDADWSSFKNYFEKAYPGYLIRLRNAHNSITEAEERMFLFIKLNLTNKESAAMLGISTESVKKSRQRLRKRLALEEAVELDDYVKGF